MTLILAVFLGLLFGFILHRVGAANPQNIIDMLRLKDFHLMKAILCGIAIASALLFIGMAVGLVNPDHLSVKTSEWGVIAGGAILGIGWAVSGYCPGTGVVALGSGRKDALFFVLGGLVGALAYMLVYPLAKNSGLLESIFGGKSTLALTPNESFPAIIQGIPGLVVALAIAAIFYLIAWKLPSKNN